MGYTTYFDGAVSIHPPLNPEEVAFINKFSETRRMNRELGPYYVDGTGSFGQGHDSDIIDFNSPPEGQPGLWCHWVVNEEGTEIKWDGGEKFYHAELWMAYIIKHFLQPNCEGKHNLPFLQANHFVNGTIEAQGEDHNDRWLLVVDDNMVSIQQGRVVYD